MKNGLVEVYDVTRLVDEFAKEEYRANNFNEYGKLKKYFS